MKTNMPIKVKLLHPTDRDHCCDKETKPLSIDIDHSLSHPTKFQPLRWEFCLPASCEVSPASFVRLPQVITALMLLEF
ncbi:hypothetical protein NC651_020713 [Populus alba x Populus x berolinensis]|nr:hypothetical protein NC651_020713 [Populus alba x Populus x berolinensis]